MAKFRIIGIMVISLCLPPAVAEASSSVSYQVETLAKGLEHPWSLAFLPNGDALVTERPGK